MDKPEYAEDHDHRSKDGDPYPQPPLAEDTKTENREHNTGNHSSKTERELKHAEE